MIYVAYTMAWICSAVAAIAGMMLTGSAWCLWVMFLPYNLEIKSRKKDKRNKGEEDAEY